MSDDAISGYSYGEIERMRERNRILREMRIKVDEIYDQCRECAEKKIKEGDR